METKVVKSSECLLSSCWDRLCETSKHIFITNINNQNNKPFRCHPSSSGAFGPSADGARNSETINLSPQAKWADEKQSEAHKGIKNEVWVFFKESIKINSVFLIENVCHLPTPPPATPSVDTHKCTLVSEGYQQLLLQPGKCVTWVVRWTGFAGEKEEENEFLFLKLGSEVFSKTSLNWIHASIG